MAGVVLQDKHIAEAERWIREPLYWARKFGGEQFDPWSGQVQFWEEYGKILNAKLKRYARATMTDEEKRYARKMGISIMAGQGVGKGATISLAGLHYRMVLDKFRPKVVCTAPAGPQLHSSLWPEYGAWIHRNPVLGEIFEKTSERIYFRDDPKKGQSESRIEPRTVQPNANAESQKVVLAGIHALGVMYQIDEGSGMAEPCFEPIEGGLTDPLSLVILIFNPTKRSGFAIETHRKNRDMWIPLHWDGEKLRAEKLAEPHRFKWFNEDIQLELKRKYGEQSDFYRVRVRGLPPEQSSTSLISYESVMDAYERSVMIYPGDPLILPVDVAGEDPGDKSMMGVMRGPVLLKLKDYSLLSTVALGDAVGGYLKRELTNLETGVQHVVGVDYIGIGRGVYAHIREVQEISRCIAIDVSERAMDTTRFHRLRDQVLWELREAFMDEKCLAIQLTDDKNNPIQDDELTAQLTSIQWAEIDGKIKVQGKGSSSGIPGVKPLPESPDKLDTLAMGNFLRRHYCSSVPQDVRIRRSRRAHAPSSWKTI